MKVNSNLKIALAVFCATVSIHVFHLEHTGFFLDEAIHLWNGQRSFQEIIQASANDSNPPFYNLITAIWGRVVGISEFSARILSVFFLALASVCMYLLMGKHFNRSVGLIAALFVAVSPIQYRFSHLARPYSLLILLAVASYGLLFTALRKRSFPYVFLYLAVTTMMLYAHPTSIFNLVPQGLIALSEFIRNKKLSISTFSAAFLSACLFGAWYLSIPYFDKERGTWFEPPTYTHVWNVLTDFCGSETLLFISLALSLGATIKWLVERRNGRELSWILLWTTMPLIVSATFSHLFKPLFQDKYLLTVQPAIMLMIAFSLDSLFSKRIKWFLALIIAGFMISNIVWKPLPEGDWKNVVAYIKQNWDENTSALVNPWYEHATFAYYFDKDAFLDVSQTHAMMAQKRAHTEWEAFADGMNPSTDKLHLLLAAEGMVPYPIDLNVLDSMARLIGYKEFVAVRVLTYDFSLDNEASDSKSLELDSMAAGVVNHLDQNKKYSDRIEFDLQLESPQRLKIESDVAYSTDEQMDEVFLVSVVLQDGETVQYNSLPFNNHKGKDIEFSNMVKFPLDPGTYQVWVYVWNKSGNKLDINLLNAKLFY